MQIKTLVISSLALSALAMVPAIGSAQTVNHRLSNQNRRIDQGIKDGELSRREVSNLRAHDNLIHAQERLDRSEHGGKLTNGERNQLNRELNRNSGRIYKDRHYGW